MHIENQELGAVSPLVFGQNVTAPFGIVGTGLIGNAYTQTDNTTAAGTVAAADASRINGTTFATAGNAITITNAYTLHISPPIAGANVTITNAWALGLTGAFKVNLNAAALPNPIAGTTVQIGQIDAVGNTVIMNSFGSNNNITGLRAQGTNAAPTAITASIGLFFFRGGGYDGTTNNNIGGQIGIFSLNNWTNADHSTFFNIQLCASGSTALSTAGSVAVTGLTLSNTGGVLMNVQNNLTNNAGASAGTLTNAPAVGNPTKWIPINDNGTTRNIPAW